MKPFKLGQGAEVDTCTNNEKFFSRTISNLDKCTIKSAPYDTCQRGHGYSKKTYRRTRVNKDIITIKRRTVVHVSKSA